jgi:hypothetical protein
MISQLEPNEVCCNEIDIGVDMYLRVPSAKSSFLRFILSFKFSASRRACWMRVCIASGDTSFDIVIVAMVLSIDGIKEGVPLKVRRWTFEM